MSLLSHTPSATADEAAALALEHFGVRGVAVPLPGERDQNFRIDVDGVPTYVLKIANGLESADLLDAQHQAAQLARLASVPTQQVESPSISSDHATWDGYIVRLMRWLPGRPLAEVEAPSPALLRDLGVTLGELAQALGSFDHPAARRDFHWDVARADVIIAELRDAVTDPERRDLVDSVRERLVTHARPILGGLPRAVIHGDANDLNVLVDDAGDQRGRAARLRRPRLVGRGGRAGRSSGLRGPPQRRPAHVGRAPRGRLPLPAPAPRERARCALGPRARPAGADRVPCGRPARRTS